MWPIEYDTIRYDAVDLRALKSWRDGQLIKRTAHKLRNKEKLKTETKWLRRNGPGIVHEGSPGAIA